MFSPQEQVLCIKSGWGSFGTRPNPWGVQSPLRGRLYTIRACWQTSSGEWWVYLNEIRNGLTGNGGVEPYYSATQFVPVKRVKTDISVFTRMLEPSPRPVYRQLPSIKELTK